MLGIAVSPVQLTIKNHNRMIIDVRITYVA